KATRRRVEQDQKDKTQRIIKAGAIVSSLVSVVMMILVVIAVWQYRSAEGARQNAERARQDAERAREEVDKARRSIEASLANQLFRPLGHDSGGVNFAEASILTALAGLPEDQEQVRVLFIQKALETPTNAQKALETPTNARRFANRFHPAIQATV